MTLRVGLQPLAAHERDHRGPERGRGRGQGRGHGGAGIISASPLPSVSSARATLPCLPPSDTQVYIVQWKQNVFLDWLLKQKIYPKNIPRSMYLKVPVFN
jgi:hypothetical protein